MSETTEKPYRVKLKGIHWDDGKGEYDVSEAPTEITVDVNWAWNAEDALQQAMEAASEDVGSLIEGVDASEITELATDEED